MHFLIKLSVIYYIDDVQFLLKIKNSHSDENGVGAFV